MVDGERRKLLRELRSILHEGDPRWRAPRIEALRQALGAERLSIELDQELGPLVVLQLAPRPAPCFDTLTPREREVAGLMAVGLRNADIALALDLAVSTVKDHVHRILTKTGLDGRAAVASAWRGG